MKYFIVFAIAVSSLSCSTSNKTKSKDESSNTKKEEVQKKQDELIKMGFVKGTIVDNSKFATCGFMIQLENKDNTMLWVPALEESYKQAGKEVYVKYTPSKMRSTCEIEGIPAIIQEIKIIN